MSPWREIMKSGNGLVGWKEEEKEGDFLHATLSAFKIKTIISNSNRQTHALVYYHYLSHMYSDFFQFYSAFFFNFTLYPCSLQSFQSCSAVQKQKSKKKFEVTVFLRTNCRSDLHSCPWVNKCKT